MVDGVAAEPGVVAGVDAVAVAGDAGVGAEGVGRGDAGGAGGPAAGFGGDVPGSVDAAGVRGDGFAGDEGDGVAGGVVAVVHAAESFGLEGVGEGADLLGGGAVGPGDVDPAVAGAGAHAGGELGAGEGGAEGLAEFGGGVLGGELAGGGSGRCHRVHDPNITQPGFLRQRGHNANNCRPKCSAYTGGIDCPTPAKLIHGVPAKRRRAATDGVYPPRPGRFVRSSDPPQVAGSTGRTRPGIVCGMDDTTETQLRAAQQKVDLAAAKLARAIVARDRIIKTTVAAGATRYAVAKVTGLTQPAVKKAVDRT